MADKYGPHVERLYAVAASPSRRLLAIAGERDVLGPDPALTPTHLHLLSLPKAKAERSLSAASAVYALVFAGDELLIAGLASGALLGFFPGGEASDSGSAAPIWQMDNAHRGAVRSLAYHPVGGLLASAGDDGILRVGKIEAGAGGIRYRELGAHRLSNRPLRAVAIDPQGALVAAAGDDGVIRSLAIGDGERGKGAASPEIREMPCGEGGVYSLCFTGDGRIAGGCGDGSIYLCYLEGAVDAESRTGNDDRHVGAVRGLVYTEQLYDDAKRPLPRRLLSIAEDGELKAWQLDTKRRPRTVKISEGNELTAMALVPSGRTSKAERRGGTLAVVDRTRRLALVAVNEEGEPAESFERLSSRLGELRESIGASSVQVRLDAVTALGALEEDEARKLLDQILGRDGKPEVRKAAADVIGKSGRRLSRPALREALSDSDKGVRQAALDALVLLEKDTPLAPVRAALGSSHADIRALATLRLPGLRKESPLVVGLIAERLSDGAAEVRTSALDALQALEGPGSVEPMRVAMQRGPADIRQAALLRLYRAQKVEDPLGQSIVEAALDDDDAQVRDTAFLVSVAASPRLAAKVRAVDERLRKSLAEIEKDTNQSGGAGAGAGEAPLPADELRPLYAALTCRNADTAMRAARCLGLIGDARATGALLQLSREGSVEVRRAVVEALLSAAKAMPEDTRLIARLEWLLDDPDAAVRSSAFEALAALGEPNGARAALELAALSLRSSQDDIRLRALAILVEFGGRGKYAGDRELVSRAERSLGDALDDESAKVRAEAFNTLWAWHKSKPDVPLTRGARCRHADIRERVVGELARIKERAPGHFADVSLISLVGDAVTEVGLAALAALTDTKANRKEDIKRADIHRAALSSPRPRVRAAGCAALPKDAVAELRPRLIELIRDDAPVVHIAAIEAADRLIPEDAEAFAAAFASIFYELRVRAMELCGKRRDQRAIEPAKELLVIPETHINRPSDALRQRAARALADIGAASTIPFYVSMLDDKDPIVREMGARGLATSCRPGDEKPLVDALSHPDLPVRSWVAEGLARLGDERAVPVLAGTLRHDHRPVRLGAIMGFVALGPDGVRGILQGLDDRDREIQDLVFAVIVARDVALARAGEAPDLLLSALSSSHPEIRFAAAHMLEARMAGEELGSVAQELVGPRKPEKAADMKDWPNETERKARLGVLVAALASDHPAQRYAATQVLTLRGQPLGFWREAGRLMGPLAAERPRIPYTSWEDDERYQPRKRGWIRSLFGRRERPSEPSAQSATERVLTVLKFAGGPQGRAVPRQAGAFTLAQAQRLVFGAYAGLIRQAPTRGEADETHRIRRDSIERLAALATAPDVGRDAVLAVLTRALSDPHHLVRKAAQAALVGLYPEGSAEPYWLSLRADAADVGRSAVDALVAAALADGQVSHEEATDLATKAVDAPAAEVRAYAMSQIQRLFPKESLDPWLIALQSRYADVRLAVVDRLVDSTDPRVPEALGRALESDHEDLRLKAAEALARRGDVRTVDVLAGILRAEDAATFRRAAEALVGLAHARPKAEDAPEVAARAARCVAARLDDDPDRTADRPQLIRALGRIGSPAAGELLTGLLEDSEAQIRKLALATLIEIVKERGKPARAYPDGTHRVVYQEALALTYLRAAAASKDTALRLDAIRVLRDIDDRGAEELLTRLLDDREEAVRIGACEALAFRAEYVTGATTDSLAAALRGGRRELVLPAAAGLAARRRPEAFQALLLVLKAGEQPERERAVLALGALGDRRALEEIEPLASPKGEIADEDAQLRPAAVEALGRMLPRLVDSEEHGDERTRVRELIEHLAKEGEHLLRKRALTGLRHAAAAGDERSQTLIQAILADIHDDDDLRVHSAKELGLLGKASAEVVLADALRDESYSVRHAARKALDRVFSSERTRISLLSLRSPHDDISAPAAAFLALRGDPGVLVARLGEIDSGEVRARLRQGLIRRGVCPAKELGQVLSGDHVGARADASWLAGSCGPALAQADRDSLASAITHAAQRAVQDFERARSLPVRAGETSGIAQPSASDRAEQALAWAQHAWRAALWAAGRLGADAKAAARDAIKTRDASALVRCEALRYLGQHGDSSDVARIQPCLTDADPEVRASAAAALAALAPERAKAVLDKVAVADAAAMRPMVDAILQKTPKAAKDMLGAEQGRRLVLPVVLGQNRVDELIQVAKARGTDTARLTAIAALGRVHGDRSDDAVASAEDALRDILGNKSEDDAVRAAAFRAVRRLQRSADKRARYEEAR